MNEELKVSFYLKRESRLEKVSSGESVAYPIIGKIIIGNSIAQFGTKLKVEERLWNVKSGRATGKSRVAVELNREINKINLLIHSHYKKILHRTGKITAIEVKNAFQGIATAQKTLLVHFKDMDYIFTPIMPDRMAMQSSMAFVATVQDYIKLNPHAPLKEIHVFWNRVNKRVPADLVNIYDKIMGQLGLRVLKTKIPDTNRYEKELTLAGKPFFRCTLLPPPAKLLKDSNLDLLAGEILKIINR